MPPLAEFRAGAVGELRSRSVPLIYGTVRREQIERAYPRIEEFLRAKDAHDSEGRFQSEWWRHHRNLIEGATR